MNPKLAGGDVNDIVVSSDGTSIVIGGAFTSVNGSSSLAWGGAARGLLGQLAGAASQHQSATAAPGGDLVARSDGTNVYGTGYDFGRGGSFEGSFTVDWATG